MEPGGGSYPTAGWGTRVAEQLAEQSDLVGRADGHRVASQRKRQSHTPPGVQGRNDRTAAGTPMARGSVTSAGRAPAPSSLKA